MKKLKLTKEIQSALTRVKGTVIRSKSMAELTWFRVGGQAPVIFQPANEEDLINFMKQIPKETPIFTLGFGSNLLVREGGPGGIVIRLSSKGFASINRRGKKQSSSRNCST